MKTTTEMERFMVDNDDMFGTVRDHLIPYLPWSSAKRFFASDFVTAIDSGSRAWIQETVALDAVKAEMDSYMPFALSKAREHRGLSSMRTIWHYRAWLFLLDDDDGVAFAEDESNYANYGVPILLWVCTKYGINFPDEPWASRMSMGRGCEPGCGAGCSP